MKELALSPFDPGHGDRVTAALRELLDLPPSVDLGWRDLTPRDQARFRVEVQIGEGAERLTLRLAAPEGSDAGWRGDGLSLEVMGDGDDGLLRALRRRLRALQTQRDGPLAAIIEAYRADRAWRAVPQGEYATIGPREVLLRLTFRCNQDCSFCWQDRTWPAPPLQQFVNWLDQAQAQGVPTAIFSGGEPTLSPHLLPLLDHARSLGMTTGLQSNAIQLAKAHVRQGLLQAGLGFVSVSYHSHRAELSDAMTRAPGTHIRTEAGILAALRDGIAVSLNLVLERRNLPELPATAAHIAATFAPAMPPGVPLTVSISHPNAYFDRDQWLDTMAPLDEVEPRLVEAIRCLRAAGVGVTATGPCGFPLCVLRRVPEVIDAGELALVAEANREARGQAATCATCAMADACIGPRNTYLAQFGERGLVAFETPLGRAGGAEQATEPG